jgi:glycosyltransferase involved in cell wall biosynthesis
MIVKNEAPVIRRCIDSVRPIIDHWVIVDTGSTDGTQEIIRGHLQDVPGELHERPWQDFARNRSEALELARGKGDYTLIIDADDTLEVKPDAGLPALNADAYTVEIRDTNISYRRIQIVRSALAWRYEGVLHEYLTCEDASPPALLADITMRRNHDGARRKDPQTYLRDAAVLEKALQSESTPFLRARYRFYLAQSYRDCGDRVKALEHYLARAELGFWQQEVFISLYRAAQMKEQLGYAAQDVIAAYLQAADALPARAEALHGASRFCRQKKRYEEGYRLAKRGLDIPVPSSEALFVEPSIYETGLLDEFSVNAYWAGHNRDALKASLRLLATGKLSAPNARRVLANARFASDRLPSEPNLAACVSEGFDQRPDLIRPRAPSAHPTRSPRVLVAILAGQDEDVMPLYLACIESLDYPKSSIVLYIRIHDSSDATERLLRDWASRVGGLYSGVEFDLDGTRGADEPASEDGSSTMRFRVPGHICKYSLGRAAEQECEFYFIANVGTFIRPRTLRDLVDLNLPIVAPFLRSIDPDDPYSNYHADIDGNGYFKECDQYRWVLKRWVRGVLEMPVVNSTYLVHVEAIDDLAYEDGTTRHEYVIFSESARQSGTLQYLDNRQVYGYHAFGEGDKRDIANSIRRAKDLLQNDIPGEAFAPQF